MSYNDFKYLLTDMAACAPSLAALTICNKPPIQSPAANNPGTLVIKSLSTTILLFSKKAPILKAKSETD